MVQSNFQTAQQKKMTDGVDQPKSPINSHHFGPDHVTSKAPENSHVQEWPLRGAGAFPGSSRGIHAGASSPSSPRPRKVHKSFARLVLFSPPNMSTRLSTLHMQWPYLAFGLMPLILNSLHVDLQDSAYIGTSASSCVFTTVQISFKMHLSLALHQTSSELLESFDQLCMPFELLSLRQHTHAFFRQHRITADQQ